VTPFKDLPPPHHPPPPRHLGDDLGTSVVRAPTCALEPKHPPRGTGEVAACDRRSLPYPSPRLAGRVLTSPLGERIRLSDRRFPREPFVIATTAATGPFAELRRSCRASRIPRPAAAPHPHPVRHRYHGLGSQRAAGPFQSSDGGCRNSRPYRRDIPGPHTALTQARLDCPHLSAAPHITGTRPSQDHRRKIEARRLTCRSGPVPRTLCPCRTLDMLRGPRGPFRVISRPADVRLDGFFSSAGSVSTLRQQDAAEARL